MADFSLLSGQITNLAAGAVASGGIGTAAITSGNVGSGAVTGQAGGGAFCVASGTLTANDLGSGCIVSGLVASGQIGTRHICSGGVQSGNILSGTVHQFALGSGCVQSGHHASGNVITYARNVFDDTKLAGQAISGVIAVALGSGGQNVLPAERQSGLRMPAIGVSITNAANGAAITFVTQGFVPAASSGTIASGAGGLLFVGSGGLIVNLSGYMGGTSSGPGAGTFSGSLIQSIGYAVSGGIYVQPSTFVVLATLSGTYLNCQSGQFPVSGFGRNVF